MAWAVTNLSAAQSVPRAGRPPDLGCDSHISLHARSPTRSTRRETSSDQGSLAGTRSKLAFFIQWSAEVRVLVNHHINDGEQWIDGEPTGHNVQVYGRLAEQVVEHLHRGSRVIVIGRTETHAWLDRQTGDKRTTTRVIVDGNGTVGLALPNPTKGLRPDNEQELRDRLAAAGSHR
jgi:hypothetical protein